MKPAKPVDLEAVLKTFEAIPELARAGAFAGANALYLEHLENPLGRFSLDIDLQNQTKDIEAIHRCFSAQTKRKLILVSRVSAEMYEYQTRIGTRIVRVEIARPYLRHRKKYQPSKHVRGLAVVSLDDLLFAKLSALSTRGFARDLIDLLAVDQQRTIDWQQLLHKAARAGDSDYNPAEFQRKLAEHRRDCVSRSYQDELPVAKPPHAGTIREFIDRLTNANQAVAQEALEQREPDEESEP